MTVEAVPTHLHYEHIPIKPAAAAETEPHHYITRCTCGEVLDQCPHDGVAKVVYELVRACRLCRKLEGKLDEEAAEEAEIHKAVQLSAATQEQIYMAALTAYTKERNLTGVAVLARGRAAKAATKEAERLGVEPDYTTLISPLVDQAEDHWMREKDKQRKAGILEEQLYNVALESYEQSKKMGLQDDAARWIAMEAANDWVENNVGQARVTTVQIVDAANRAQDRWREIQPPPPPKAEPGRIQRQDNARAAALGVLYTHKEHNIPYRDAKASALKAAREYCWGDAEAEACLTLAELLLVDP